MSLRLLTLTMLLLVPTVATAADLVRLPDLPVARNTASVWAMVADEPAMAQLVVGDQAPGFSYLGVDGRWHQFADLADRPLLLVFGARDSSLAAIAAAGPLFREIGLTPVAVLERGTGAAESLGRRLHWPFPMITDPKRAIAGLYNSLDPRSLGSSPSYFVIDGKRTIRALAHGPLPPASRMIRVGAQSLGLPLPESALLAR